MIKFCKELQYSIVEFVHPWYPWSHRYPHMGLLFSEYGLFNS